MLRKIVASLTAGILITSGYYLSPAQAESQMNYTPQVSAGYYHTCALTTSGSARCWGSNDAGQIDVPTDLGVISQINAGAFTSCAVTIAGALRCWGNNNDGETNIPSDLGPVSQVDVGEHAVCAIKVSGSLRCWGRNWDGESNPPLDLGNVIQVSIGASHACAVTLAQEVRCWGQAVGYNRTNPPSDLGPATNVSVGPTHACAIRQDGKVVCWGSNSDNQASVGAEGITSSVSQISAGVYSTCAVESSGSAHCWGNNQYQQSDFLDLGTPGSVVQVSSGYTHSCAVTSLNTIKCFGQGLGSYVPADLALAQIQSKPKPAINGAGFVGSALGVYAGSWGSGVNLVYQWLRDGIEISSATSNSFITTIADAGHSISVRVTGSLEGYQSASMVSEPLAIATSIFGMGSKNWSRVASSADGTKLAAVAGDQTIWTSPDSGATWFNRTGGGITSTGQVLPSGTKTWGRVASSSDGKKLAAVLYNGNVWTSADSGVSWVERSSSGSRLWSEIASSADGIKLVAVAYPGGIWTSNDSGETWLERTSAGYRDWGAVASSADGSTIVASWNNGNISVSHDSGSTWTVSSIPSNYGWWRALASSDDGTKLYGVEWCGGVWQSRDSGATWSKHAQFSNKSWYSIAVNTDGTKIVAGSWEDGCGGQPTDGILALGTSLNTFSQTATATLQGVGALGTTLQTRLGTYPTGTAFSYQWLSDGVAISGANSQKFAVRAQDLNHAISYQVTASKSGYETLSATSNSLTITKKSFTRLVKPMVTGAYRVNSTLRTALTPMGTGVNYTKRWLRDGVPISGATDSTYSIVLGDLGSNITFKVCGSKELYETTCLVSDAGGTVTLGQIPQRPLPRLSFRSIKVGAVLEGKPGNWQQAIDLEYFWLRDGLAIPNAKNQTYTITESDRGHSISFKVIARLIGYNDVVHLTPERKIP